MCCRGLGAALPARNPCQRELNPNAVAFVAERFLSSWDETYSKIPAEVELFLGALKRAPG